MRVTSVLLTLGIRPVDVPGLQLKLTDCKEIALRNDLTTLFSAGSINFVLDKSNMIND